MAENIAKTPIQMLLENYEFLSKIGFMVNSGWFAFATLLTDHNVPLAKAIEAELRSFYSLEAGQVSYYVDRQAA